jgi:hypothetical protein
MKTIFINVIFVTLVLITIYLTVDKVKYIQENNLLVSEIVRLRIEKDYKNNIINTEYNLWQIEYFLKEVIYHSDLEKVDKLKMPFLDLIKNDSKSLCFFINEKSCSTCIEIELNRIKTISDSVRMPINIICISKNWRFINLLKQNYGIENEIYRLNVNYESFNEDLILLPFYFIIDEKGVNSLFIPLKEQLGRTIKYFEFIKTITNS